MLKFVCPHCGAVDAYIREETRGPMIMTRSVEVDEDGKTWLNSGIPCTRVSEDDTSSAPTRVQFFCSSCDRPLLPKPTAVDEGHRALAEFVKALPCNRRS